MTTICMGVGLVLAIAVIFYLVYSQNNKVAPPVQRQPVQQPPLVQRSERQEPVPPAQQRPKPYLVLFYGKTCPPSQAMLPHWEQAKQVIGDNLVTMEVSEPEEINRHGISGVPTLRLYPSGYPSPNFIEYPPDRDRSAQSIVEFARTGGEK